MTFVTQRLVEFRDTDAAGIIHFSAYFPMMEAAEHEMIRSFGTSVHPRHTGSAGVSVTWPRVAATCDFLAPVRFEDLLTIEVAVARLGSSSVQYRFDFSCEGRPVARGTITVVCCRMPSESGGHLQKTEIPADLRARLEEHLAVDS